MTVREDREEFANRLRRLWLTMNEAMSQGHNHKIFVDPEMVDDIRACEALVRSIDGETARDGEKYGPK